MASETSAIGRRSEEGLAQLRAQMSAAMQPRALTSFGIADQFFQYLKKSGRLRNRVFADVGANLGSWTQPFALRYWRILAFEAYSRNFEALSKKFAGSDYVELIRKAVWDESGRRVDFFYDETRPGIGSIRNNSEHFREETRETVETITIADALGPDLEKLELIKTDVEGAELQTLKGADLPRAQPSLIVAEISGRSAAFGYGPDDLAAFIAGAGYDVYLMMAKARADSFSALERIHFAPYTTCVGRPAIGANMDALGVRKDIAADFADLFGRHFVEFAY